MEKNNGKIAIAIVAMFVVALSIVGFTYAYFVASVTNNDADTSVQVTAGELVSKNKNEKTETYELKLPSDNMFKQVHGDVTLRYIVYKEQNVVMLDTITPTDILLEGHMAELTTYKGVMISKANASKDMFKIDLLNMLQNRE